MKPETVAVMYGRGPLLADLESGPEPKGLVIFAHGSGSGRHSLRNNFVAAHLRRHGLATLMLDLLTLDECRGQKEGICPGLSIRHLGERVAAAVDWARHRGDLERCPVGLYGSSTGSAAALVAASLRPEAVDALVSRGGRPDLAWHCLQKVKAPVRLIVGGADTQVLDLNRGHQPNLGGPSDLRVVPGAGHLFEEPGALEAVAELSLLWFQRWLADPRDRTSAEAQHAHL